MLSTSYAAFGLIGTIALSILTVLTVVSWMVALAGAASRPMRRSRRVSLIALLTAIPPSAIGYLAYTIVRTGREYRSVPVPAGLARGIGGVSMPADSRR